MESPTTCARWSPARPARPRRLAGMRRFAVLAGLYVTAPTLMEALPQSQVVLEPYVAAVGTILTVLIVLSADAPRAPTMTEVLAASKPTDWRVPDPENTLYLELATGRVCSSSTR